MTTLTITAKGQVTLRKDVLQHLGVRPGQKITVNKLPDGRIEVKAATTGGSIRDAYGILGTKNEHNIALSLEEINDIAAQGWTGKK